MSSGPLADRVTLVAGATRGAGRAIARMLGAAGATVYCTGRSVRGRPASGNRPETIEETAELVEAEGGRGVAVQADHTVESEVVALFERVASDHGRLDVLVNDVWGGDALTEWGVPFWKLDLQKGFLMLDRAVRSHIITSRYGVPMMVSQQSGLVVEVTDGATWYYRGNQFYDLAKTAGMRLAFGMAEELKGKGVTALAVTPGFLRSEAMLDHFGVTEEHWRDAAAQDPHFLESETPAYLGRGVAALAADPDVSRRAGRTWSSARLAREYGLTDVDGRQPDFYSYLCASITTCLRTVVETPGSRDPARVRKIVNSALTDAQLQPVLMMARDEFFRDVAALPDPVADDELRAVSERHFRLD